MKNIAITYGYYNNEKNIKSISFNGVCVNFYGDYGFELDEEQKLNFIKDIENGIKIDKVLEKYVDYFVGSIGKSYNGYTVLKSWKY